MVKRLMALFVLSGMFFSGAKADDNTQPNNIQEVVSHTVSETYFSVSYSFNESFVSTSNLSDEIDQESTIDLRISNTGSHLKVTTSGDGSDIPELALDGIKMLTQTIKPEQAAVLLIKFYKESMDELSTTMPDAIKQDIEKLEKPEDLAQLFGTMMQLMMDALREKSLDLAVMQAALPKNVWLECEAAIIASAQEELSAFYSTLNTIDCNTGQDSSTEADERSEAGEGSSECASIDLDKAAFADIFSTIMKKYSDAIIIAIVEVFEKYYDIDRVALGLDPVEQLVLEEKQ